MQTPAADPTDDARHDIPWRFVAALVVLIVWCAVEATFCAFALRPT